MAYHWHYVFCISTHSYQIPVNIRILTFGIARDICGDPSISISIDDSSTVDELRNKLEQEFPSLKEVLKYSIAVNLEYAQGDMQLSDHDEVALIPPVSGG